MQEQRRKPSDYPQFAFRVTAEKKDRLSEMINEVTELFNKNVSPGEYLYRKNDIIIEALEIGLKQMKKHQMKQTGK